MLDAAFRGYLYFSSLPPRDIVGEPVAADVVPPQSIPHVPGDTP